MFNVHQLQIGFKYLDNGEGLALPRMHSVGAAGLDLHAAIDSEDILTLAPGKRAVVPCGFAMALPEGFEAQVRPRSGLAVKHGITVLNAPGTIDADYRGEVMVPLINLGDEVFEIRRGDRIAQMVVAAVTPVAFEIVSELDETLRGSGGFGSTGHVAAE